MAEKTNNYNLEKQQLNDYINIEGINENLDVIDEQIKNVSDKADQAFQKASNPAIVNGHKVEADVPPDAKFTDTVYIHPNSGVTAGTYRRVTVNTQGHVMAGDNLVLGINEGGTGATTAGGALANLGACPRVSRANWVGNSDTMVVGEIAWRNYGNSHTIFDASSSTAPSGTACNPSNSTNAWTVGYPTLMGFNGTSTYGVRVDSARIADSAGNISFGTNDLTPGVSALAHGSFYFMYE